MNIRRYTPFSLLAGALLVAGLGACSLATAGSDAVTLPDPAVETAPAQGEQVAVLAGGCFWGLQSVFEHVKGVRKVWAGYSGGDAGTAEYDRVSDGDTGHAESVKIVYDPSKVSYGQLLKIYFSVATDPTQLNRQGPDVGTQYRSAIFYGNDEQKRVATAYVAQLTEAHAFNGPIVTQVVPLKAFYAAESYHQDYAERHPNEPYIVYNDAPKVAHLKQLFPSLYRVPEQVVAVQLH
ncbi:MAG TPA: peptide-methionine (S)-S-oxide reductase MsrA [Dyella sp.]|uniref:peptide-methionine (S)-S-oxide reductase MsrA n=1 Tax=Dyella sp. TaxID=1869338 RepID=UPI002D79C2D2|nr:peptide-methionine (S)-S-oxide reductase MsrA [Dyella sp.]HET6554803.1 peptide-methionine (S)-S-oxide reductase MsrA [Dyella sp.]